MRKSCTCPLVTEGAAAFLTKPKPAMNTVSSLSRCRFGGRWGASPTFAPVGLVAALFFLAGCASSGGSGDYTIDQSEIATYALPSDQEVSHHPDSLAHLQIVEKNGKLDFQHDRSYRDMLLEWSVGQQRFTQSYFRTHATLWSRELSLASLIPERSIDILSKKLARKMIDEREAEYDSVVQIDVYIFAPSLQRLDLGDLQLDVAGKRVYLRDEDDNTYKPVRIDSNAPMEAFHAGRRTLYGRNAVFFRRHTKEGKDLLDAERLRLYVRPAGYYFTWTLPGRQATVASAKE